MPMTSYIKDKSLSNRKPQYSMSALQVTWAVTIEMIMYFIKINALI